jgi:uncharacterized membrane protein
MAALCSLYVLIRFWRLTDSCLWFDEIFSVHAAEHSWNTIFSFIALDLIHPPLFYILLKLWISIGGSGLEWVRLFPVAFAVAALFAFLMLCRELRIGIWTQAVALLLITVNGSLIKYAQEVRMYSPFMCFGLFSMWLFARFLRRGDSFVPLVIVNICLIYTHNFGWLVVASEAAAILIFQRSSWRRLLIMLGVLVASFLPWVIAVVGRGRSDAEVAQNIDWIPRPGWRPIRTFLIDLIEPFYFQATTAEPTSLLRVAGPIFLLTLIAGIVFLIRWKAHDAENKRNVYFLSVFAFLPLAIAFAASWVLPYSIWGTRHLLIVFVPVTVLIAYAFTSISPGWLRILLIAALVGYNGYGFAASAGRPFEMPGWCGFDVVAKQSQGIRPGPIYVFEDLGAYHIWYTLRHECTECVTKIIDVPWMEEDKAFFFPRGVGVPLTRFQDIDAEHLWVVYRAPGWNVEKPPLPKFAQIGYQIEDKIVFEARLENVYAVLLKKKPAH